MIDQAPPQAVPARSAAPSTPAAPPAATVAQQPVAAQAAPQAHGFEQAAAGWIETGLRFLESLVAGVQKPAAGEGADGHVQPGLSNLVSRDPRTGRTALSIPLPQSVDEDRLARVIAGVLSAFGRSG